MSDILFEDLLDKLTSYKKKYYTNSLIKGSIFSAALIFSIYILFNTIEHLGRLSSGFRLLLLIAFCIITIWSFWKWLFIPISQLFNLTNQLSDEEAAIQIGKFFPEINDKLINTIQLRKNIQFGNNDLINASIDQKTKVLTVFPFLNAVDLKKNRQYSKYIILPLLLLLFIILISPDLIFSSTKRIIYYNTNFAPPAPFQFKLVNKELKAFKNEDYKLNLNISGDIVPQNVYLVLNEKKSKLIKDSLGSYTFVLRNVQQNYSFYFEAAGYNSQNFNLEVIERPSLVGFSTEIRFPEYLNKKNEINNNTGNLIVPEGSSITWNINSDNASSLNISFNENIEKVKGKRQFTFQKKFRKSTNYGITLFNDQASSKEEIQYAIEVIPDLRPTIDVHEFKDTITYKSISLAGIIGDDYGLSKLELFYSITDEKNPKTIQSRILIPIDKKSNNQRFNHLWNLDTLALNPGEQLQYYLKIWDNDGVNGSKSTQSKVFNLKMPNQNEINNQLQEAAGNNEKNIEKLTDKARELKKNLKSIEDKLKNKNNINWQDKNMLEEALKQHKSLEQEIQHLQKENKAFNDKSDKFKPTDPELAYKIDQLQKLINELLDEDTKKLYEELQKLLKEKTDKNEIQDLLERLQNKDENLSKELERTLEMFKQLNFEKKLNETIDDLKKLSDDQEKLSNETENSKEKNSNELFDKQDKLNEQFKEVEQKLEELSKDNDELKEKKDLGKLEEEQHNIKQDQQKSSDQLKASQQKKAAQSQKNAADKMKEMAEKLSAMQESMEMEQAEEDLGDLRAILENLITLSFDQEQLMKDFRVVNQSDPRFISLSQQQLKLKDDSKIIEDSLFSLAKRVFQIESFVTKEVNQMKSYMDESSEALKIRRPDIAIGKQQFAMTSINNLALLLNDVLKQMQDQMANSMASAGKACNKPKKKGNNPGMGDLQKQLNSKINELKQSGKSGKELSEELAKLSMQQEMIRKALKELEDKDGKEGTKGAGGNLDKLRKQMEETENELVNKKLSQQTLNRQQEILTRLLEAEKAAKEREIDHKRESNTASDKHLGMSPTMEKYLKEKEKEVDLLKTISPQLTPFYKQEVQEYFQKIEK